MHVVAFCTPDVVLKTRRMQMFYIQSSASRRIIVHSNALRFVQLVICRMCFMNVVGEDLHLTLAAHETCQESSQRHFLPLHPLPSTS